MYDPREWQAKLDQLRQAHLIRDPITLASAQGARVVIDERDFLNFSSNDYLGLAAHPDLAAAACDAIKHYGVGSGASHKVCGHHYEHECLQNELAQLTGRDKAILFSTGYMANLAVVSALSSSSSLILQDKLNHASLLDAAKLAGARSQRYLHSDIESLRSNYRRISSKTHFDNVLVATDGVFSMDGDVAPLRELSSFCDEIGALMLVDDAHGLGVMGGNGAGSVSAAGLDQYECPLYIGTFGKAVGTQGAFLAGPKELIDFVEQVARPLIYTTAMPPAIAAATRASIKLISSDEGALRRKRLKDNVAQFQEGCSSLGLPLLDSDSAIQCLLVGDNQSVVKLGSFIKEQAMLVGAIRPPTVPVGTARLRVTISAAHTSQDISSLLSVFSSAISHGALVQHG